MLGENIKKYRQKKGFTQEELAIRLHVVRQNVSKWEKDLSVPDATTLQKISEVLEVTVEELLGATYAEDNENEVAKQLSRINEQLAIKNNRSRIIWKTVLAVIIGIVVINILIVLAAVLSFRSFQEDTSIGMAIEYREESEVMPDEVK